MLPPVDRAGSHQACGDYSRSPRVFSRRNTTQHKFPLGLLRKRACLYCHNSKQKDRFFRNVTTHRVFCACSLKRHRREDRWGCRPLLTSFALGLHASFTPITFRFKKKGIDLSFLRVCPRQKIRSIRC